jgi:rubrerythrin
VSDQLNLEHIDVDGAVRETAAEAMDALDGDTRSAFLRRAGLAGGALVGGGAILGALAPSAMAFTTGDRPPAKFGKGDIGILNYALTLEYLESTFYNEATIAQHRKGFIKDFETRVFLRTVTDDENAHVKALKRVLGKHAVKKPKFDFHGDNANEARFKTAAFTFENEGVHAYSGQAFNIKEPKVLAAALSIVTVEARHASVIGLIRQRSEFGISPSGAFDKPYGASRVLKDVSSLHYIKG